MGVWIDTDMGFDDIMALLVVARSGLQIDGVSLVFGCASLDRVEDNAARAAQAFAWRFPFHRGRAASVLGQVETAANVLGDSGIRSGEALPRAPALAAGDAFAALCDWLQADGPRRVLALGPLTNIAALALARPDLATRITDLTWMGGGITAGNHTASAEFNAYADPEALAIVLAHGLPLRMVDLDLGRTVFLAPGDVPPVRAAGGANAGLLADLLGGYLEIATSRGRAAMALYDPSAAVAFVSEDIVTFEPARIDVELCGSHTRGRTVVERRKHAVFNAEIATEVDAEAARALILGAIMDEARR